MFCTYSLSRNVFKITTLHCVVSQDSADLEGCNAWSWRSSHYYPSKYGHPFTSLHVLTSQKTRCFKGNSQVSSCLGQSDVAACNWATLESTVTDHRLFFLLPCNRVVCNTHGTAKESEWRNTASCAMIDSRPAEYDTRQNDNPGDDDSKLLLCVNIYQYRRRLVPKDSSIHTHCCETFTSHWWKGNTEFPKKSLSGAPSYYSSKYQMMGMDIM